MATDITLNPFKELEHVLNHAALRYHLTRPSNVGPVMELIRQCQPSSYGDWETYYWQNAYTKRADSEKVDMNLIHELGERLYEKIQAVIIPEWTRAFERITKQDCIDYILDVTIRRTYCGYLREKSVVHDNLAKVFPNVAFEESDSDLDHAGSIDYIGKVKGTTKILGLQIKPVTAVHGQYSFSVTEGMKKAFARFQRDYGGQVFVVYSEKEQILNKEVVEQIRSYLNES